MVTAFSSRTALSALIALLPLTSGGRDGAKVQPQSPPFAASDVTISRTNQTISFTLRNLTRDPITAWHVSVEMKDSAGTATYAVGLGVDGYLGFEGLNDSNDFLPASGSWTKSFRLSIPDSVVIDSAAVEPNAAVFANGTAWGNPVIVTGFSRNRQRAQSTWEDLRFVVEGAVGKLGATPQALKLALSELDTGVGEQDHPLRQVAITNMRLAVEAPDNASAKDVVATFLSNFRRHHEAARRHAQIK